MSPLTPPSQSSSPNPRRSSSLLRTVLLHTRGLIMDQHLRRVVMFYAVLVAMLMVFFGWEFLRDWMEPHQHFYRFAAFWLTCGWLTILAALLAIYDLLMVRLQARVAQRALRAKMLGKDALHPEDEP